MFEILILLAMWLALKILLILMILVVFVSYSYFILPMPKVFIKKLKNLKLFYQNSIRSLLKYSTTYLQDVKLELKQLWKVLNILHFRFKKDATKYIRRIDPTIFNLGVFLFICLLVALYLIFVD